MHVPQKSPTSHPLRCSRAAPSHHANQTLVSAYWTRKLQTEPDRRVPREPVILHSTFRQPVATSISKEKVLFQTLFELLLCEVQIPVLHNKAEAAPYQLSSVF